MSLSNKSRLWLAATFVTVAVMVLTALVLPRSFRLTAFSDIIQALLLLSGALAFIPLAVQSRGRVRLFWSLITLGTVLWFSYQMLWTIYEVVLRRDVPDLCTWDVVLFLHIVPFMAALALRPHMARDEYAARIGQLDFALLLVWWFYQYVLIVMPWQYVIPDVAAYNRNLNAVYLAEKLALLTGLVACWITSKTQWKQIYAGLFAMTLCYSVSSTLANWAIGREVYYTGSLYDIPLVVSMASLTWIGLRTRVDKADATTASAPTIYGVWVARFSMIAVFSLPAFAAWSMSDVEVPARIRVFRLTLTLLAAFLMGIMVFMRQRILDRELIRLLDHSRESFDHLKRLQAQILQSEKLASITQLVGGAAHELNNPITAMLGYSDLLLNTKLSEDQQPLAAKIGQYVRRTKSLVASLISFARQTPAPRSSLDLNTLARTALKLTQTQWETLKIEVRTQFDPSPAKSAGRSQPVAAGLPATGVQQPACIGRARRPLAEHKFRETRRPVYVADFNRSCQRGSRRSDASESCRLRRRTCVECLPGNFAGAPRHAHLRAPRKRIFVIAGGIAGGSFCRLPAARTLQCRCCGNLNRSLKLPARRVDVAPARTPHKCRDPRIAQRGLKLSDLRRIRRREVDPRPRIQRNQVHLAAQSAQQFRHFPRMNWFIVHATKQDIFKCDPLARAQRIRLRRRNQQLQIPFFVQRHDARAQLVIRRIQRNRQLRTDRFFSEVMDARHNPRRRNGHPPLCNSDFLH